MKKIQFTYKFLLIIVMALPISLCSPVDNEIEDEISQEDNPVGSICDQKPNITVELLGQEINEPYNGGGFGEVIDLNGDGTRLVVGSPSNSENGHIAGKVSIYEYVEGSWKKLGDDILGKDQRFNSGHSVAINKEGNIVSFTGLGEGNHGSVYQFLGGNWVQMGADIKTPDGETGSNSIVTDLNDSGTRVVFGSSGYEPQDGISRGGARVYEFLNGSWTQLGKTLWIEDCLNCLYAGSEHEVSISGDGNRVALGVEYRPPNSIRYNYIGVFEYDTENWNIIGSSGGKGSRVSLNTNGTKLGISDMANGRKGDIQMTLVTQLGVLEPIDYAYSVSDTSFFGYSFSISGQGNRLIVYEPLVDSNSGNNNGITRVYFMIENKLCEFSKPISGSTLINNSLGGNWFYGNVKISSNGKRFAVGTSKIINNQYDGIVRVYEIIEK